MTSLFIGLFALMGLIGCSTSPKSDRTFAEKLNMDSYESSHSVNTIPVLNKEAHLKRKISGRIYCGEGLNRTPANGAQVSIVEGDKDLALATSESTGEYSVMAPVKRKQTYQLRVTSKCGSVMSKIVWDEENLQINKDIYLNATGE